MKTITSCFALLMIALSLGTLALGCDDGSEGGCALPEKCGEPPNPEACHCFDGTSFHLPDGDYFCKNGCLLPGGGGIGGFGGAGSTSSSSGNGGAGGSGACTNYPVGRVCVRGEIDATNNQELLKVGAVVTFQMFPKGCFSSSCTSIHEASCTIMSGMPNHFDLGSTFCLEDTTLQQPGCTPDCNGGGFATCDQPGVAEGTFTASIDNLQLSFTVPQTMPLGGICVGNQF